MMKKLVSILGISFLLCSFINAHAEETSVPPLINYQGMLTDADGKPMTGTTKKLEFNIYDSATGGTKIWGPQIFNAVPLIGGKFNVILGTTDNGGKSITEAFGAKDRYLGIKVDAGSELVPRQHILSAPYTIKAEYAERASHADIAETVQGDKLYVDPVTGNVGVGTNSPVEKLEVAGTLKATAYKGDGAALTGIRGCGWEGWKCHCSAENSGGDHGRMILGINCYNGVITDFKLVGMIISSGSAECPNAWVNCDDYSSSGDIPEH
jgi:hypothetical protein